MLYKVAIGYSEYA